MIKKNFVPSKFELSHKKSRLGSNKKILQLYVSARVVQEGIHNNESKI